MWYDNQNQRRWSTVATSKLGTKHGGKRHVKCWQQLDENRRNDPEASLAWSSLLQLRPNIQIWCIDRQLATVSRVLTGLDDTYALPWARNFLKHQGVCPILRFQSQISIRIEGADIREVRTRLHVKPNCVFLRHMDSWSLCYRKRACHSSRWRLQQLNQTASEEQRRLSWLWVWQSWQQPEVLVLLKCKDERNFLAKLRHSIHQQEVDPE